jgi:hypothetical protein
VWVFFLAPLVGLEPTTPTVRNIVALLAVRFALLVFLPAQASPSSATGSGEACAS